MGHSQRTLRRTASFTGVALHSGVTVSVEIRPARPNTGILFQRTDLPGKPYIKAIPENVFNTKLATKIGSPNASVSTIEHLMAAFYGFGIDNAVIALDHEEVPILDGSSAPFLVILDEAGILDLKAPRKLIVIQETIEVVDELDPSRFIRIEPSKTPRISYAIDFKNVDAIGTQKISLNYTPNSFCEEICYARTFGIKEEVEFIRSKGLAKGASIDNAIVVSQCDGVLNKQGLRHNLEFVRHKALDCMGDLHLLGGLLLGHIIANKAGHDLHSKLAVAIQDQVRSRRIIFSNLAGVQSPEFKSFSSIPRSLVDVSKNLVGLAVG